MKNIFLLIIFSLIAFLACNDDHSTDTGYDYHAHIHSPLDTMQVKFGDSLKIDVTFESHTGKTVHHINIKILNKDTNEEVYSMPVDSHVNAKVEYDFIDYIGIHSANGFGPNTRWVLKALVWGEEDGEDEESSQVEFTVIP